MTAINITYFQSEKSFIPVDAMVIVGDERAFLEAFRLFYRHHPEAIILRASKEKHTIINAWAQ